ncbi:hypothetical protein [Actinosynnema sp. NPDC023587]|uniref:hypothetical protein n=1 Tax=Actinosynnema sp. NPDC023587 TaxID=3154695 RepID=UPI0033D56A03
MTKVETEPRVLRTWRGIGGCVAVGLVLLALALIGVQVYAGLHDLPGPGVGVVAGHLVAAGVAVVAQVVADRRTGWVAGLCGLAVLLAGASTLWFFWWA